MIKKNNVAIVFAGGGVTGYFFEAGCLKGLRQCGVQPDAFSGVSAGAVVAAIAAHGEDPEQHDPFDRVKIRYFTGGWSNVKALVVHGIFDRIAGAFGPKDTSSEETFGGVSTQTIWDLGPLETYLRNNLPPVHSKSLFVTATNIDSGDVQVFTENDDVPSAVRASCSLPGITTPPLIDGCHYVDGIVSCCANMAPVEDSDIIICVNPITFNERRSGLTAEKGLVRMLDQSFRLVNYGRLQDDITRLRKTGKKIVLIEPKGCQMMARNPLRKDLKAQAVQSGYDYTITALREHVEWFDNLGISLVFPESKGT